MVFREGRRSLNKNITGDLNRSKNSTEVEVSSKSVLEINKTVKNKKYCFHTKLDSMTQRAKRILKGCLALFESGYWKSSKIIDFNTVTPTQPGQAVGDVKN